MPKVALYNIEGSQIGEIELCDEIFNAEISVPAMHQVVVAHLAAKRQGTQSALTRSEVSGGGRKPWRQKGTGRARQGSTRSPQWRHGGVVFAPKPRDYTMKVNKKVRRLAMKSALTSKVAESKLIVLDKLELDEAKTKKMLAVLKNLGAEKKALVVLPEKDEAVERASGNLQQVTTTLVNTLNVYDILNHDAFIVTKSAIEKIQEVFA